MRGCAPGVGDFSDWSCAKHERVHAGPDAGAGHAARSADGGDSVDGGTVTLLLAAGLVLGGGGVLIAVNYKGRVERKLMATRGRQLDPDTPGTEMGDA